MEAVLLAAFVPAALQLPRRPVWPFFAIFVSLPVFLILERCNIDVLIATIMIAAGYFGSTAAFTASCCSFFRSGPAQFYCATAFAPMAGASLAILAVAFLMSARANLYGVKACGVQGFKWAYGWKVLSNVLDELLSPRGIHLHSVLMALSLVCTFAVLAARASSPFCAHGYCRCTPPVSVGGCKSVSAITSLASCLATVMSTDLSFFSLPFRRFSSRSVRMDG